MDQQLAEPSRFLSEVPADLMDDAKPRHRAKPAVAYAGSTFNTPDAVLKALGNKDQPKTKGAFSLGITVKHAKYGYGTILRTEGAGDDLKLTISFISHGLKKLVARYAELEQA